MPIINPLPFAWWGMDILEHFPKATDQWKYLFVAVDYFIKWVEVEVIVSITMSEVRKFVYENIITYFGIPRVMIFDNGWQFNTAKVTNYLSTLGCQAQFTRWPISRPMAKPRLQIKLSCKTCERNSTKLRENGSMNYIASCGQSVWLKKRS